MSIAVLLVVLLVFAYLLWSQTRRTVKLSASTPTLSCCLPLIGHAIDILNASDGVKLMELLRIRSKHTNEKGGVAKFWVGPVVFYMITDPEDALTVLNKCLKKSFWYRFFEPYLGQGLFTARSGTIVGIPDSHEDLVGKEYMDACENIFEIVQRRLAKVWLWSDYIFSWSHLKIVQDESVAILHKMSNDLMEKNKLRMQGNKDADANQNIRFKSFTDILLELSSEGALTDQEIRDELDVMILGGHDTTGTALLLILIVLGSFDDIQERVYDELRKVFGTSDRDVTKEDLPQLVYLEAVMKETMRLYPVGSVVLRHADTDVKLRNCIVPAGATVIVSVWGIHRNECWGQDVEQFRPERWLEETQVPQGAFAAFSLGRRGCIGKTYAYMSMKTTLVHLLRRYRFNADHNDMTLKLDAILKVHSGGKVAIELRQ